VAIDRCIYIDMFCVMLQEQRHSHLPRQSLQDAVKYFLFQVDYVKLSTCLWNYSR